MRRLLPIALIVFTLVSATVRADGLMVIANVPEGARFEAEYALALLRGDSKNWDGGFDARVVLPSREAANHERVANTVFATSGKGMQRRWFRMVFAGRVNPPEYLDSDLAIIRYVLANEGALAVISSTASGTDGLQTAAITP